MIEKSKTDRALIDIILPHKERFTAQNGGAVSTVVYELARHQSDNNAQAITIFGSPVDTPKGGVCYHGLALKHFFWQSRNISLARAYLRLLKQTNRRPALIEVHGRPQVARYIAAARPDLKITLYLHNDPRTMKGASSVAERKILAQKLAGIFSITDYVKSCFTEGLAADNSYRARHFVNLLGVDRTINAPQKRKKQLFLAGRMVPEKGILEACLGAIPVLKDHPDWQICLAGGKHFTADDFAAGHLSDYETQIAQALAPLGAAAMVLGHQPLDAVRKLQQTSEICIVPSLWQEPGGLTVLEALSAGAALITTNRGGIPEFASGRAILLDDVTPQDCERAIRTLIEQPKDRAALQDIAWQDYPFSAQQMSQRAATYRASLIA